jgi:diaminopimelate epimerase
MAEADVRMQLFNLDGSQPEACGNGTRCAARLMMDETGADRVTFQVINRIIHAWRADGGLIEVDMGEPMIEWQQIPLSRPMNTLHVPLPMLSEGYSGDCVCTSMGNPHATLFVENLEGLDICGIGAALETDPLFPAKANIGFVQLHSRNHMSFRVWERGSGATLACGSAVCAAAVGAIRRGMMERRVTVDLELGSLEIEWKPDNHVYMTGPAAFVAAGTFSPEFLALL